MVILPSIFKMAVSIKYLDGLSPSTAWSPIAVLQAYPLLSLIRFRFPQVFLKWVFFHIHYLASSF